MNAVKYISHHDIDFEKWDKIILSSPFPLVFAQSFYLNATSSGWNALVIGDYESVFPLTEKQKFSMPYLSQPSFTPQLGVYGKTNNVIEQQFFDYVTTHYKLIEIELNAGNMLQTASHFSKTTYIIDYKNGYKFNQNTKRNISKAVDHQLIVEQIPNEKILQETKLYLHPFLSKQLKLSRASIHKFDRLIEAAMASNTLFSFRVVNKKNEVQAIAHFISNGKHTVYLKGINFDKEENLGSMHLLNSYAIQFFETRSATFDFGGGMKESLANFYKGFGASPQVYSTIKFNKLPWLIKIIKNLK